MVAQEPMTKQPMLLGAALWMGASRKVTVFIFFVGEAASIGHYRIADPRLFTFMKLPRDWKPC